MSALVAPAQASPPDVPVVRTGTVVNYTLYGSALTGWGFDTNATNPGPHLTVQYGDTVQLTLISLDGAGVDHNWFIDYDNSSAPSPGEPSSPTFTAGNSIVWTFVPNRIGTFVYRCEVHPSSMMGLITIKAPTHYTLYGDALTGWGFNATNLSAPGPTLIVQEGVNVTLTLYAVDGTFHTWFIDLDNSSSVTGGETESPRFGGSGNPNPLNYTFNATRAGTFAYRCGVHLTSMWGMIVVIGTSTGRGPSGFPLGLIPGIMVAVIVGVLILAAVYQVRATRTVRLKK